MTIDTRGAHGPAEESDGPPDELEIGQILETEAERLAHHPKQEFTRLKQVAAAGEEGSSPYIEILLAARWIIPLVIVMIGIALLVYFKA